MGVSRPAPARPARHRGGASGRTAGNGAIGRDRPCVFQRNRPGEAGTRSGLEAAVREALRRHRLAARGDRVLVALSGGPDSVALLHALWVLSGELGITVCAAHLDHRLRGRASAADAAFARSLARRLGVRFLSGAADVRLAAARGKRSLETAAREARQLFLARAARRLACGAIATGHTRDDQAETVLMRLLRGTGLSGLAGIPRCNGQYIRPLLGVRREQVLAYLAERRLPHRLDRSNLDTAITRNRIRHRLLPQLAGYNPRIVETLARLADTSAEDLAVLREAADRAACRCATVRSSQIAVDLGRFNRYNKGLRRMVLRWCAARLGCSAAPECGQVDDALALMEKRSVGARFRLADRVWIEIGYRAAAIGRLAGPAGPAATAGRELALRIPGVTRFGGFALQATRERFPAAAGNRDEMTAWFDRDEIHKHGLTVGSRRPGERIIPFRASHRAQIARLMVDAKIARGRRGGWPVVRCRGAAAWIPGVRRSSQAPVTPRSRNAIKVVCIDEGNA